MQRDTPIVVISGDVASTKESQFVGLGVVDFICKPVQRPDLLACVETAAAKGGKSAGISSSSPWGTPSIERVRPSVGSFVLSRTALADKDDHFRRDRSTRCHSPALPPVSHSCLPNDQSCLLSTVFSS